MTAPLAAAAPLAGAGPSDRHADRAPSPNFHAVLSALNPLQYVPVIGTIYRAATGDTIPEAIRRLGSLVVSALMGGPVGIAINLATMAAEKIAGIDLDRTGQALLLGKSLDGAVANDTPPATDTTPAGVPADRTGAGQAARDAAAHPPLPAAAVTEPPVPASAGAVATDRIRLSETLRFAGLLDADGLNTLELARIHAANAAYARVVALVP